MRFAIKTSPQNKTLADMLAMWQAADDGPCLEGWVTTTAPAQATEPLRVGVLATGNVYRHPVVLAYGIQLPRRERFDMFDEAVEVMVKVFSETTANFAGKHDQLNEAYCEPKPVQQPLTKALQPLAG